MCHAIKRDFHQNECCSGPRQDGPYEYAGMCMSHVQEWDYVLVDNTSFVATVYRQTPFAIAYDALVGYRVPALFLNCPGSLAAYPFLANLYTLEEFESPARCGSVLIDYVNLMNEAFGNETLLGLDVYNNPPSLGKLQSPEPVSTVPPEFTTRCADIQDWYVRAQATSSFDEAWRGMTLSTGTTHWSTVVIMAGITGCEITYTGPSQTVNNHTIDTNFAFTLPFTDAAAKDAMKSGSGKALSDTMMYMASTKW